LGKSPVGVPQARCAGAEHPSPLVGEGREGGTPKAFPIRRALVPPPPLTPRRAGVPRLQIVTVEQLLASPASPIRIPMARSDTYRKAAREERFGRRGALDL